MNLIKLENQILELIKKQSSDGGKFWYWTGADHFEPANYAKEQEKYGMTKYNMALESLEVKGLIKPVRVKGAANAEYYRIVKR